MIKFLEALLRRFFLRNTPAGGIIQANDSAGRIYDGVPYTLPLIVPEAIRDNPQAIQEFAEALGDEFKSQFGTPYQSGNPVRLPTVNRPLEEWDYPTRKYVLEQCHLAWERNPIAKTAVFYTRAFSVGNGASIAYKNKEVEAVCEAFINDPENAVRDLEKSTVDGLFIDGEAFFRFFRGDGTEGELQETKIVPLVPWGIIGIRHAIGFFRRVEAYRYNITQDNGDDYQREFDNVNEDIPAGEVHHLAINRLSYERRGRPDLFVMLPWLQAYKEWLENRARQNFWRGAVLFWVKLINALPSQVMAKLNAYKRPPQPGSVVVSNDKEEWNQFSPNVGANDASEDGRAFRAMAATGARLPESWLSDGANANLATATAQALPAITSFGEYQDIMVDQFWKPILKRAIQNAVDAGMLPETVPVQDADGDPIKDTKPIKAVEAFEATYSDLSQNDPKTIVEALALALTADLISTKTARGLTPWQLDSQMEEKNIEAERQKQVDAMAAGLYPMPFDPINQNGNGATNGQEPDEQPDDNRQNNAGDRERETEAD